MRISSLSDDAMTTKRCAADATTFSRVWAPPPLTSLIGAIDGDVQVVELAERRRRRPRTLKEGEGVLRAVSSTRLR